ncbi:hypothetical protein K435DRAFT_515146 [Dendrothele bispora CBS 962.96]|uniref:Uncharacterized protein n=1 Tax=Dendrothele bispora (strain CBS 962.96) TaxID=1314807 RepID=A0A4S8MAR4_DENBC|nr:hypothetical protein K435DRAFT_515146 [Dendrothele bispora CBS 962.96]
MKRQEMKKKGRSEIAGANYEPKERAKIAALERQLARERYEICRRQRLKATVFSQEEEEEATKRRKVPSVKLDFSVAETGEKLKERLENIRQSVPHDKESLFKLQG